MCVCATGGKFSSAFADADGFDFGDLLEGGRGLAYDSDDDDDDDDGADVADLYLGAKVCAGGWLPSSPVVSESTLLRCHFLLLQEHQLAPVDLATQLKAFFEGLRRSPGAGQALLQAGAAGLQQQERDDLLAKLK